VILQGKFPKSTSLIFSLSTESVLQSQVNSSYVVFIYFDLEFVYNSAVLLLFFVQSDFELLTKIIIAHRSCNNVSGRF
jgi:hypothetical protein